MTFEITDRRIEPEALKEILFRDSAGAFVAFEGWVRDHNDGQSVAALEYEAHAPVATKEGHLRPPIESNREARRRTLAGHAPQR